MRNESHKPWGRTAKRCPCLLLPWGVGERGPEPALNIRPCSLPGGSRSGQRPCPMGGVNHVHTSSFSGAGASNGTPCPHGVVSNAYSPVLPYKSDPCRSSGVLTHAPCPLHSHASHSDRPLSKDDGEPHGAAKALGTAALTRIMRQESRCCLSL